MSDLPTTWADLLTRFSDAPPANILAEDSRSLINSVDRISTRVLNVAFTGAAVIIPDFVDTPGDESGELTLDFGTVNNGDVNIVAGVVEVLQGISFNTSNIAINFTKTGGGGSHTAMIWLETSADGIAWTTRANSARFFEIAADGEGTLEISFAQDQVTSAGTFFRMKISDITGGTGEISMETPVDVNGFSGTISGFAVKATFLYQLEQVIAA